MHTKKKSVYALSCEKANPVVALATCAQSKFINPQSSYELFSWSPRATQSKLALQAQAVHSQGPTTALVCHVESLLYHFGESTVKSTVVGRSACARPHRTTRLMYFTGLCILAPLPSQTSLVCCSCQKLLNGCGHSLD